MLMQARMRLMPEMDTIGMISGMMGASRAAGWAIHFVVGTILCGLAYGWIFAGFWPDAHWLSGAVLGVVGWLIAMLVMMPVGGKGAFGMNIGAMAPAMSLTMHVFFGVILGEVYGGMVS